MTLPSYLTPTDAARPSLEAGYAALKVDTTCIRISVDTLLSLGELEGWETKYFNPRSSEPYVQLKRESDGATVHLLERTATIAIRFFLDRHELVRRYEPFDGLIGINIQGHTVADWKLFEEVLNEQIAPCLVDKMGLVADERVVLTDRLVQLPIPTSNIGGWVSNHPQEVKSLIMTHGEALESWKIFSDKVANVLRASVS